MCVCVCVCVCKWLVRVMKTHGVIHKRWIMRNSRIYVVSYFLRKFGFALLWLLYVYSNIRTYMHTHTYTHICINIYNRIWLTLISEWPKVMKPTWYTHRHTHTLGCGLRLCSRVRLYIYIYIYIYIHLQTDRFGISQLFNVARYAGRFKQGSKPAQLYVKLTILLLKPWQEIVSRISLTPSIQKSIKNLLGKK